MSNLPSRKRQAFLYAVLHARFEIRQYFLNTMVKEIYENIGQALSLAHIQLSLLDSTSYQTAVDIEMPKHLVVQSIKDLRFLCTKLFFDLNAMDDTKWIEGIEYTIKDLHLNNKRPIHIKGPQKRLQPELLVLLFRTIQEVLFIIKDQRYIYHLMRLTYTTKQIIVDVIYSGEFITEEQFIKASETEVEWSVKFNDRLHLINADVEMQKLKAGKSLLKLALPLNFDV